jgi:hypothetical protein
MISLKNINNFINKNIKFNLKDQVNNVDKGIFTKL